MKSSGSSALRLWFGALLFASFWMLWMKKSKVARELLFWFGVCKFPVIGFLLSLTKLGFCGRLWLLSLGYLVMVDALFWMFESTPFKRLISGPVFGWFSITKLLAPLCDIWCCLKKYCCKLCEVPSRSDVGFWWGVPVWVVLGWWVSVICFGCLLCRARCVALSVTLRGKGARWGVWLGFKVLLWPRQLAWDVNLCDAESWDEAFCKFAAAFLWVGVLQPRGCKVGTCIGLAAEFTCWLCCMQLVDDSVLPCVLLVDGVVMCSGWFIMHGCCFWKRLA